MRTRAWIRRFRFGWCHAFTLAFIERLGGQIIDVVERDWSARRSRPRPGQQYLHSVVRWRGRLWDAGGPLTRRDIRACWGPGIQFSPLSPRAQARRLKWTRLVYAGRRPLHTHGVRLSLTELKRLGDAPDVFHLARLLIQHHVRNGVIPA